MPPRFVENYRVEQPRGRGLHLLKFLFSVAVGLGGGSAARAQVPQAPPESPPARAGELLGDPGALVAWIARRSSDVAAARFEAAQAQAAADGARLLPNPNLDASVANLAVGESNPRGLGVDRTAIFGVGLSETVAIGKRGPRVEAAALRARAASTRVGGWLGERVADARLVLGRAVYVAARSQALAASLAAARAATQVVKGRLEHQSVAGVDYDRLLLDLTTLEAEATRGRAEAEALRSLCSAALLARCDLEAVGPEDLARLLDVALPEQVDLDEIRNRADVASLELERQAALRDATLAARRAIPDVTARLGYTHDNFVISGDIAKTIAFSVAIPLPLFDRGQHDRALALAHAGELDARARGVIASARGNIAALGARRQALEMMLATVTRESVPRARSILAAEESGFAQGQVDTTELLLARRQAIATELQVLDLRYELFATKNEIRRGLGIDGQST